MPELRIGVQLASLRQPFKKALHIAGDMGADGVEIDARNHLKPGELTQTGRRQLQKMLADRNLRVCAVGFQTRSGYNVRENLSRRVDATKEAMRMAYSIGAPVVINQIGRIPSEPEGEEWDLLVEVLSDLGRFGQHVGAVLAAETGSEDPATLRQLIEALPPGGLAINLDPGNLVVNGFSAAAAIPTLGPYTLHVHAKDGVRDLAQGRGLETQMGRGSVDFAELIGGLEEHDYGGYFTIEREQGNDPVGDVQRAVQYLRSL